MILTVKNRSIEKKTKYDIKKKIRSEPLIYIVKTEEQHKWWEGYMNCGARSGRRN